jgi:hypothetical protein
MLLPFPQPLAIGSNENRIHSAPHSAPGLLKVPSILAPVRVPACLLPRRKCGTGRHVTTEHEILCSCNKLVQVCLGPNATGRPLSESCSEGSTQCTHMHARPRKQARTGSINGCSTNGECCAMPHCCTIAGCGCDGQLCDGSGGATQPYPLGKYHCITAITAKTGISASGCLCRASPPVLFVGQLLR